MTVEERRAIREALVPLVGKWTYSLTGLPLLCPACLGNEWLEGATVVRMNERERLPNGQVQFHFGCPDCGLQVPADFLLYDLLSHVPDHTVRWN